jgi:hypothetical protein
VRAAQGYMMFYVQKMLYYKAGEKQVAQWYNGKWRIGGQLKFPGQSNQRVLVWWRILHPWDAMANFLYQKKTLWFSHHKWKIRSSINLLYEYSRW